MRLAAAVRSNLVERSSRASRSNAALWGTARMFLKLVVVAVLFLPPAASGGVLKNIVIVVIDDAGVERFSTFADPNFLAAVAETPNINALAASGVQFNNFWAYPVCSPFRASLLTGVGPWGPEGHGVGTLPDVTSPYDSNRLKGLDAEQMNIAHMLSAEGYRTEAFGKWHVAGSAHVNGFKQHPIDSGFHLFDGGVANPTIKIEIPETVTGYSAWERCSGTSDIPVTVTCQLETTYSTTYITDAGITCLQGSEPFLCYVAHNAAHAPFHNPPPELQGTGPPFPSCTQNPSTLKYEPPENCHKAMLQALDTELGRLIAAIDFNDTTLFVVSDNGTPEGVADGPYPPNHSKGTVYQGGLNTPLIVKGKAVTVAGGTTVDDIVQTTDIFATLAWIAKSSETTSESVSLKRYLTDPEAAPQRTTVMVETFKPTGRQATPDATQRWLRTIADECYKLSWNFNPSPFDFAFTSEFFNLCDDPFEEFPPLDTSTLTPEEQDSYDTLLAALGDPHLDDVDGDGYSHYDDNCITAFNPDQDDTDGDDCGNLCDADYDQSGTVGVGDFGDFNEVFNTTEFEMCHFEPIEGGSDPPNCVVGVDDFAFFVAHFNNPTGPSGTTAGTMACP